MILSSLILTLGSFSALDLPTPPVANAQVTIAFADDASHSGYLELFVTNDNGTYLSVNGSLYRLPPGTKVPPYGVLLTLHGVTQSDSPDTDFYATSVTW